MHQFRHSRDEEWRDSDYFDLRTLTAGQQVRIELDTQETLRLYRSLRDLYSVSRGGVPDDHSRFLVVEPDGAFPAHGRELIQRLLTQGDQFWATLEELAPEILENVVMARLHYARIAQVEEFARELELARWSEGEWEIFFRRNRWIFGHGLAYQFLSEVQGQPYLGGTAVDRSGGVRGDFLMATEARVRFTVLVDIKKPNTPLLDGEYRNRAFAMSSELVGGVAQIQAQCSLWADESQRPTNRDRLETDAIYTCDPKGILVIGNTGDLTDRDRHSSFERFRRSLHNPEILTFDELLERARLLLSYDEASVVEMGAETGGSTTSA